jgi:hypothetical protein
VIGAITSGSVLITLAAVGIVFVCRYRHKSIPLEGFGGKNYPMSKHFNFYIPLYSNVNQHSKVTCLLFRLKNKNYSHITLYKQSQITKNS